MSPQNAWVFEVTEKLVWESQLDPNNHLHFFVEKVKSNAQRLYIREVKTYKKLYLAPV